jgi:hypothetical protein
VVGVADVFPLVEDFVEDSARSKFEGGGGFIVALLLHFLDIFLVEKQQLVVPD